MLPFARYSDAFFFNNSQTLILKAIFIARKTVISYNLDTPTK